MEKLKLRKKGASLGWIAELSPGNCPGGEPKSEAEWRELVNKIVLEVRNYLKDTDRSDRSDRSDTLILPHGG